MTTDDELRQILISKTSNDRRRQMMESHPLDVRSGVDSVSKRLADWLDRNTLSPKDCENPLVFKIGQVMWNEMVAQLNNEMTGAYKASMANQ
jgi:hypothetical protein